MHSHQAHAVLSISNITTELKRYELNFDILIRKSPSNLFHQLNELLRCMYLLLSRTHHTPKSHEELQRLRNGSPLVNQYSEDKLSYETGFQGHRPGKILSKITSLQVNIIRYATHQSIEIFIKQLLGEKTSLGKDTWNVFEKFVKQTDIHPSSKCYIDTLTIRLMCFPKGFNLIEAVGDKLDDQKKTIYFRNYFFLSEMYCDKKTLVFNIGLLIYTENMDTSSGMLPPHFTLAHELIHFLNFLNDDFRVNKSFQDFKIKISDPKLYANPEELQTMFTHSEHNETDIIQEWNAMARAGHTTFFYPKASAITDPEINFIDYISRLKEKMHASQSSSDYISRLEEKLYAIIKYQSIPKRFDEAALVITQLQERIKQSSFFKGYNRYIGYAPRYTRFGDVKSIMTRPRKLSNVKIGKHWVEKALYRNELYVSKGYSFNDEQLIHYIYMDESDLVKAVSNQLEEHARGNFFQVESEDHKKLKDYPKKGFSAIKDLSVSFNAKRNAQVSQKYSRCYYLRDWEIDFETVTRIFYFLVSVFKEIQAEEVMWEQTQNNARKFFENAMK